MTSMPPATGPALIILVAFVLPGFVTVLLQERTFKSADDPTPLDRLLRIAMYSVLSYLLIAIAAIVGGFNRTKILNDYHHYTADPAQLVWRGVVLVVIPSLIIATATFGWSRFKHREAVMEFFKLNPASHRTNSVGPLLPETTALLRARHLRGREACARLLRVRQLRVLLKGWSRPVAGAGLHPEQHPGLLVWR